jgi:hypothetical protein
MCEHFTQCGQGFDDDLGVLLTANDTESTHRMAMERSGVQTTVFNVAEQLLLFIGCGFYAKQLRVNSDAGQFVLPGSQTTDILELKHTSFFSLKVE